MNSTATVLSLIAIQDQYIATVNKAAAQYPRRLAFLRAGAHRRAKLALAKLGYTDAIQIEQIIQDARDVAYLERREEGGE